MNYSTITTAQPAYRVRISSHQSGVSNMSSATTPRPSPQRDSPQKHVDSKDEGGVQWLDDVDLDAGPFTFDDEHALPPSHPPPALIHLPHLVTNEMADIIDMGTPTIKRGTRIPRGGGGGCGMQRPGGRVYSASSLSNNRHSQMTIVPESSAPTGEAADWIDILATEQQRQQQQLFSDQQEKQQKQGQRQQQPPELQQEASNSSSHQQNTLRLSAFGQLDSSALISPAKTVTTTTVTTTTTATATCQAVDADRVPAVAAVTVQPVQCSEIRSTSTFGHQVTPSSSNESRYNSPQTPPSLEPTSPPTVAVTASYDSYDNNSTVDCTPTRAVLLQSRHRQYRRLNHCKRVSPPSHQTNTSEARRHHPVQRTVSTASTSSFAASINERLRRAVSRVKRTYDIPASSSQHSRYLPPPSVKDISFAPAAVPSSRPVASRIPSNPVPARRLYPQLSINSKPSAPSAIGHQPPKLPQIPRLAPVDVVISIDPPASSQVVVARLPSETQPIHWLPRSRHILVSEDDYNLRALEKHHQHQQQEERFNASSHQRIVSDSSEGNTSGGSNSGTLTSSSINHTLGYLRDKHSPANIQLHDISTASDGSFDSNTTGFSESMYTSFEHDVTTAAAAATQAALASAGGNYSGDVTNTSPRSSAAVTITGPGHSANSASTTTLHKASSRTLFVSSYQPTPQHLAKSASLAVHHHPSNDGHGIGDDEDGDIIDPLQQQQSVSDHQPMTTAKGRASMQVGDDTTHHDLDEDDKISQIVEVDSLPRDARLLPLPQQPQQLHQPQFQQHRHPRYISGNSLLSIKEVDTNPASPAAAAVAAAFASPQAHYTTAPLISGILPTTSIDTSRASFTLPNSVPPNRRVRFLRNYSHGMVPRKFDVYFPPQISGHIQSGPVLQLIEQINSMMADAERLHWTNAVEGLLSYATFYIWQSFVPSRYKRIMRRCYKFIDEQNRAVFEPAGLHVVDPRLTGFLFLEIRIIGQPTQRNQSNNTGGPCFT